jgi:hypothetical protein
MPPLPLPPPFLPPHMLHLMGGGQHPIPGMAMNAPWYMPPYGTLALPPPSYPQFHQPHLAHGAGIGAAHPLPQGFAHHPVAPAAPVPDVVETDGTSLVDEVKRRDGAPRSAEDGRMEGGDTAVMSTVAAQPSQKKYPNYQVSQGGKQHQLTLIKTIDTEICQSGSFQ